MLIFRVEDAALTIAVEVQEAPAHKSPQCARLTMIAQDCRKSLQVMEDLTGLHKSSPKSASARATMMDSTAQTASLAMDPRVTAALKLNEFARRLPLLTSTGQIPRTIESIQD